jgi:plastocyanin
MTTRFRQTTVALCAASILALAACRNSTESQGTAVTVKDNTFEPSNLLVTAGQTVTWTWNGSNPHTVTFASGGPNSPQMSTGTFQRQFSTAGTFNYTCAVHGSAMSGVITVQ